MAEPIIARVGPEAARPPRDGCLVAAGPLSVILRGFVADWNRGRPPARRGGPERPTSGIQSLSAYEWIEQETTEQARSPGGVRVSQHQAEKLAARTPMPAEVELRVADSLLTAIGRQEELRSLPTRPNPRAAPADRACCGRTNAALRRFDTQLRGQMGLR